MATPLNAQKIDPGNGAAAAAAATTPAKAVDEKAVADDDDTPYQSFEGPEKVLEIWWTEKTLPVPKKTPPVDGKVDPNIAKYKRTGLRTICEDQLKLLLKEVHCQILSSVSNAYVDAYLLSESSMFVYPYQIVLKTCGTTTLLNAIQPLLNLARDECGLVELNNVFYCRKNFLDPTKQLHPHTSWEEECKVLNQYFNGDGCVMGRTTGDHWYLYTTDNQDNVSVLASRAAAEEDKKSGDTGSGSGSAQAKAVIVAAPAPAPAKPAAAAVAPVTTSAAPAQAPVSLEAALQLLTNTQRQEVALALTKVLGKPVTAGSGGAAAGSGGSGGMPRVGSSGFLSALNAGATTVNGGGKGDQTLELLMSELDPKKMKIFTKMKDVSSAQVTERSGIGALYPDSKVDAFVFDPLGYSMNGICDNGYYTIHITPQPNCSYASFETNIPQLDGDYFSLIQQNLDIFGPGKFTLILFTTDVGNELVVGGRTSAVFGDFNGYTRSGASVCPFATYTVIYCHYHRVGLITAGDNGAAQAAAGPVGTTKEKAR